MTKKTTPANVSKSPLIETDAERKGKSPNLAQSHPRVRVRQPADELANDLGQAQDSQAAEDNAVMAIHKSSLHSIDALRQDELVSIVLAQASDGDTERRASDAGIAPLWTAQSPAAVMGVIHTLR
jgi:hypothetical protein